MGEGVYDVAWSEENPNHLVTGEANGRLLLLDTGSSKNGMMMPLITWHEHQREVNSVDWNTVRRDRFLSASYDGSIKILMQDTTFSYF